MTTPALGHHVELVNLTRDLKKYPAMSAAQIFLTKQSEKLQSLPVPIIIHGNYRDAVWQGRGDMKNLAYELRVCDKIRAECVIVHLHKRAIDPTIVNFVINDIKTTAGEVGMRKLCFELNVDPIWRNVDNFNTAAKNIMTAAGDCAPTFCIDSCHLYASGVHTAEDTQYWLDSMCVRDQVYVHFNDSASAHLDRHAGLGRGLLGESIIAVWMNFIKSGRVKMCIFEHPEEHLEDSYGYFSDLRR
jgi:endonuclease IV